MTEEAAAIAYILGVMADDGLILSVNEHRGDVSVSFSAEVGSDDVVLGRVGEPVADTALRFYRPEIRRVAR